MLVSASSERSRWLQSRHGIIGASEVAAVLGLSPYESPFSLWAKKTGAVDIHEPETPWQRWGSLLEPVICDEYERETGRKVIDHGRYALRLSQTCPHLGATLDREVVAFDERGPGCLEAKNVTAYKASDWEDGAPLIYQIQIQAQLEVTGYRWGSAAALVGGNEFKWCDVERDEPFIEMMRRKVAEFWQLVETKTPPKVDGSEATAEVLKRLYPGTSGETIALPGEALNWTEECELATAQIKEAEARCELARNQIRAALGTATFGALPDGSRWSAKVTKRKGYVVEATEYRALRRVK